VFPPGAAQYDHSRSEAVVVAMLGVETVLLFPEFTKLAAPSSGALAVFAYSATLK
jgi:hypothetical protein